MNNLDGQKIVKAKVLLEDVGVRLDVFLCRHLPDISRVQIGRMIKEGRVFGKTSICKPSFKVSLGETYLVVGSPVTVPSEIKPQSLPLDIIFADEHIVVLNKPKGLAVHPGAGLKDGTLCNALLHHFPDMVVGNEGRPGIVHRLDKNTSGVMVVAKSHEAHRKLSQDFKDRLVKKVYLAICWGRFDKDRLELVTGHVRHPYNRLKFFTGLPAPKNSKNANVRMAHTSIEVLAQKFGISILKAYLHTGRTHQIRAHLADILHPLLGDTIYGGKREIMADAPPELKLAMDALLGQALHAQSLAFVHPVTQEQRIFKAPLPDPMAMICKILNLDENKIQSAVVF